MNSSISREELVGKLLRHTRAGLWAAVAVLAGTVSASELIRPSFLDHPRSQAVPVGGTAVFTVTTDGTLPMGYRWRHGTRTVFHEVLNAHAASLVLTNVQPEQAGVYTVAITNAAFYTPGVLSQPATLTVETDLDGDGLDDQWEEDYFGDTTNQDGEGDPDGDGFTDGYEVARDSDPNDPEVVPPWWLVTNLADGGEGSLRHAIDQASPGLPILFDVTGTILLTNELVIDKDVNIRGPGPTNLAISGQGTSRVFRIEPGVSVCIADLSIVNGRSRDGVDGIWPNPNPPALGEDGGGILNAGTLSLSNCVVRNNVAGSGGRGGSQAGGGRGGGIYNIGRLSLTDCTVSGNTTDQGGSGGGWLGEGAGGDGDDGGGVFSSGTVTLTGCILSGNATGSGGRSDDLGRPGNAGSGGAFAGQGQLHGCTLTGNSAGSGGGVSGGELYSCLLSTNRAYFFGPSGPDQYGPGGGRFR